MIIVIVILLGLCLGSFVNALTWRLHEQEKPKAKTEKLKAKLSIAHGRSMCPHCKHELAVKDLVPVLSWVWLRGRCRYCKQPISVQYPLVELATVIIFVFSAVYWPYNLAGLEFIRFGLWLVFLTGFMALMVYDFHWMILPDKIVYPLLAVAVLQAVFIVAGLKQPPNLMAVIWGVLVGGGIFYLLFQLSKGTWIGGGDVKLGGLLGILLGGPLMSLLMLFLASLIGTLVAVPLLLTGKAKRTTHLPFGPFLIMAAIILQLFGAGIVHWYKVHLLAI